MINFYLLSQKISIIVLLYFCTACGGTDSNQEEKKISQSNVEVNSIELTGIAVAGIIKNAHVKAYSLVDGVIIEDRPIAQTRTKGDGTYTLLINNYTGPISIKVTPLEIYEEGFPSTMICDVDFCDDEISFGDEYILDSNFELSALVPDVSPESIGNISITALTTLAHKLAEDKGQTFISKAEIINANSQVSKIFEMPLLNILEVGGIDITDEETIYKSDVDDINAAIIGASILQVGMQDLIKSAKEQNIDVGNALIRFSNDFIKNDGQIIQSYNNSEKAMPSMMEVWEASDQISKKFSFINAQKNMSDEQIQKFTEKKNDFKTNRLKSESKEGMYTSASPTPYDERLSIEGAKKFINDLRALIENCSLDFNEKIISSSGGSACDSSPYEDGMLALGATAPLLKDKILNTVTAITGNYLMSSHDQGSYLSSYNYGPLYSIKTDSHTLKIYGYFYESGHRYTIDFNISLPEFSFLIMQDNTESVQIRGRNGIKFSSSINGVVESYPLISIGLDQNSVWTFSGDLGLSLIDDHYGYACSENHENYYLINSLDYRINSCLDIGTLIWSANYNLEVKYEMEEIVIAGSSNVSFEGAQDYALNQLGDLVREYIDLEDSYLDAASVEFRSYIDSNNGAASMIFTALISKPNLIDFYGGCNSIINYKKDLNNLCNFDLSLDELVFSDINLAFSYVDLAGIGSDAEVVLGVSTGINDPLITDISLGVDGEFMSLSATFDSDDQKASISRINFSNNDGYSGSIYYDPDGDLVGEVISNNEIVASIFESNYGLIVRYHEVLEGINSSYIESL